MGSCYAKRLDRPKRRNPRGASRGFQTRANLAPWYGCRYGVRSAVTRRAWRIIDGAVDFEPATRRQEGSKFGQACCEQSLPTGRISSRSALARACGTLASTVGAKPGKMVNAVAMSAAKAIAESALIMTVPCHGPFGPSFRRMDVYPPQVSGCLRRRRKWFRPGQVLFRRPGGMKHCRLAQGRRGDPET